jgi:hypothetical protein
MKRRAHSIWQKHAFLAAIAIAVLVFAEGSVGFAQAGYKVGSKIEVQGNAEWFKAEVLEVKGDSYKIAFDGYGSAYHEWVKADRMRPIGANRQSNNQNAAANQVRTSKPENQTAKQPARAKRLNKYGARDPRTCENTIAPTIGAMTPTLAKQYFICQAEGVSGAYLYLVENEKVEVGGDRPYSANADLGVPDIDPKAPIYPIRGSYTRYQCLPEDAGLNSSAPGKNCSVQIYRKATGECYKTTFGDWRCSMTNGPTDNDDYQNGVPPPK